MSVNRGYPSAVAEVLDPPVYFRRATIDAVRHFARSRPWRGSVEERQTKFQGVHAELCRVYNKQTTLRSGVMDGGGCSGSSHFIPARDEIVLVGRLSVVTYFHEFAHALGRDERGAVRWSANLFRLAFPRSFGRCSTTDGHMLRAEKPQH